MSAHAPRSLRTRLRCMLIGVTMAVPAQAEVTPATVPPSAPSGAAPLDYAPPDRRTPVADWMVECYDSTDPTQRCQMYQRVILRATDPAQPPRVVLVATFAPGPEALRMQIALPLGLDLDAGAALVLTGADGTQGAPIMLPITRCTSRGCLVEGMVDAALASALAAADRAEVLIVNPESGRFRIPLSMKGYASALGRAMQARWNRLRRRPAPDRASTPGTTPGPPSTCIQGDRRMRPEPLADLVWIVLSANGLEQTMLVRLLERQHYVIAWRGRPDRSVLGRIATEAEDAPRGVIAGLGSVDFRAGVHDTLFRMLPHIPLILFLRDEMGLPEPLALPSNVVGTLGADCSEEMAEHALFLIRMGYGILPHRALGMRKISPLPPATQTGKDDTFGHPRPGNGAGHDDDAPQTLGDALTPREREVAWWICRGRSNKEIARHLGVSFNTVNAHAGAIRRKLRARNRTEVAMHLAAAGHGGAQDAADGPRA